MELKPYPILSPTLALELSQPSIFLKDGATADLIDVYFNNGEVVGMRKRLQEYSKVLPDAILRIERCSMPSSDKVYDMVLTKRDVTYWDQNNERFVYLTKMYTAGAIVGVSILSGGRFQLTFNMPSGESLAVSAKAGDFIRLSSDTSPYTSDDTWYEIDSVDAYNEITCTGVLPSGYDTDSLPSGGDQYALRQTFAGTDEDYWHVDTINEHFVATNNGVDFPIRWTGTGQCSDITNLYKCRSLCAYEARLNMFYTIEEGQSYPKRVRWSELYDETAIEPGIESDAGAAELDSGIGYITRGILYKGYLFVFMSESIVRMFADGSDLVYNIKLVRSDVGTIAGHSIIENADYLYFHCTKDMTIQRFDVNFAQEMSQQIDYLVKNVTAEYAHLIQATFITEFKQVIFAIPYAGSTTINKLLMHSVVGGQWSAADLEITCFGRYVKSESFSWDTLPYGSWLDWNWMSWRSRDGLSSFGVDLCGDSDGQVSKLFGSRQDNGADYTRHIVFETDLGEKGLMVMKKRMLKIQFYVRAEAQGHLDISIKRDLETSWQSAGVVSLVGTEGILTVDLPVDFTAKTFKIKIESEYDFNLLGFVPWYVTAGVR